MLGKPENVMSDFFLKDSTVRLGGSLAADVMICDKFSLADDTLTLS